ncbi:MAG: SMI1/KNR4 family protein [Rhodopirellula sp.]|nr:SMI1/KNR4 family protein [Rhodopirellula sp.]
MGDLIGRIKARVANPMRAVDSAAWVRPLPTIAPPATTADVDVAEAAFGFSIPPLLRQLYTEVGNGNWGPSYGFQGIPTGGAEPDGNDIVGFYLECMAPERALESPAVEWPRGLVMLIGRGCVDFEVCDFLRPPYSLFLLSGDTWDLERPLVESLTPVAASLVERLEAWLAT